MLGILDVMGAPLELVAAVLAAWPDGARVADSNGKLPLHDACGIQAAPGVVHAVLAAFPGAASVRDGEGNLPALGGRT